MATSYVGYRPVLKGRNSKDAVHPYTGKVAVYSNYSIYNTSQVLDGAPDNEIQLGTERPYSRVGHLEYVYSGRHHLAPLRNPDESERTGLVHTNLTIWEGVPSAKVFSGNYSREKAAYTNFFFRGLDGLQVLKDPGHAPYRAVSYATGFKPYENRGVSAKPLADPGQAVPSDNDGLYGYNKVNQWHGLTASKAL